MSSRQTGTNKILAILSLYYLIFNENKNILFVSNKSMTYMEFVDIFKECYQQLPFFFKRNKHV